MKKKIFSLLAVLLVAATAFATFVIVRNNGTFTRVRVEQLKFEQKGTSFTLNGIDVNDIANIYNREWRSSDDYERAFTEKYLDAGSYALDRKRKMNSLEFKAMLKPLIEKYAPDSMAYFNSRIADVDVPLTRCLAVGMCFYTARCIGVLTRNSNTSRELGDHFWDGIWDNTDMQKLLPYEMRYKSEGGEYDRVLIDALLWNDGHISLISNREVVSPYGDSGNWDWDKPFTWENAVRAITRLHDSIDKGNEEAVFVPITDKETTTPDPEIITSDIMAIAAKSKVTKLSELRKLSGPQTAERMNGTNDIPMTNWTRFVEDAARWGFNSFLYMFPSNNLVHWDDMTANLSYLRMLDRLVAACVENDITLRIEADCLPGAGMYFGDDKFAEYIEDFSYDLTACEKGCQMWKMLSERYKDIPSEYLIFTPVNGKYDPGKHTAKVEDIAKYMCKLIDQIREVSPNRFIYYSYTGNNSSEIITNDNAKLYYETIESKYDNVRIMRNFAEVPYVFYTITPGINMDLGNHSSFICEYPLTIYAACPNISHNNPMTIDGCLPAGTKIDIFLMHTSAFVEGGKFYIYADGDVLHEEAIPYGQKEYESSYRGTEIYSSFFPYAESNHKITISLDKEVKKLYLDCTDGCGVDWCGMDVYLPESYQVERWYQASPYDISKGYEEWFWGTKKTSRIMISPNHSDTGGSHLTIHENVTFTSDGITNQSNKETVNAWGDTIRKFSPKCAVNVEAQNYGGCTQESMIRYCDDVYGMLYNNGFDFWMSDFDVLYDENASEYRIAWRKVETYDGYANFNLELLRTLQKYQYK